MAKESADEAMMVKDQDMRAKGSPQKSPNPVSDELPPGMSTPTAPGEQSMGGVEKGMSGGEGQGNHMGNSSMGAAVKQVEYETERGSHAPGVGGYGDAGMHHTGGVMRKD